MSTSYDVRINVQSFLGFRRPDYAMRPGLPSLQTIHDLNGNDYTDTGNNRIAPILVVDPITDFTLSPETTSTAQTIRLRNFGNSTLTVAAIVFSNDGVEPIYSNLTYPFYISSGTTATFTLSYTGSTPGEFQNYFNIVSNLPITYKVPTKQVIDNAFYYNVSPTSVSDTITGFGERKYNDITLSSIRDVVSTVSASVTPNSGYILTSVNTTTVSIYFDADYVSNDNGTYPATLTVTANDIVSTVPLSTIVNIDHTKYKNLANWISPAASYNSIIGISFDLFDNKKILTIGVGLGADGCPIYGNGGQLFADLNNLGYKATTTDTQYPYWTNIYSFELDNTPRSYMSGELDESEIPKYILKTTDGFNYADYFGFEQSNGSMFLVEHDGAGNINIEINNLREFSGDAEFDATLDNLTRAFHYYSNIDSPERYYQLESPVVDGTLTHLFRGFDTWYDSGIQKWSVSLTTVPLPT